MFNFVNEDVNDIENMLFNNESKDKNMFVECSFCQQVIKTHPCMNVDRSLFFCDMFCGKLYYDNVEKFELDIDDYNRAYVNKQLDKNAIDVFNRVRNSLFEMLPRYVPGDDDVCKGDVIAMKMRYNNIVKSSVSRPW